NALGDAELAALQEAIAYYHDSKIDPGYQGTFEKRYTDAFVKYMGGGGYADAVATGTAALYIAVAALGLPRGSEVIVSPVTDPGTLAAVILNNLVPRLAAVVLNNLVPRLADGEPSSFNMGAEQFVERV